MRFLNNITDEEKQKLCHELALEYAKKVSDEESRGVLEGFELHESLLCHYAYAKEQYEKDFYNILSKYERAIQDNS
ncbi:hypothetical protein ACIFQM_01165 [Paenibacillus sp. NRS-1782]|uniref:hypothetical protein n=1 Tax=unclassified Paenibacillus TaxID=185978 RepID=UPI003D293151